MYAIRSYYGLFHDPDDPIVQLPADLRLTAFEPVNNLVVGDT